MSLSVDSTFQDACGYRLWNTAYASLIAYQQALIAEAGAQTLTQLKEFADYIAMPTGGSVAPDEWRPWFIAEAVWQISNTTHPERATVFRKVRDEAKMVALTAYARKAIDYSPGSDAEAFTYTFQALRFHIINHCVRQKPMLFPAVESVDAAIDWALKRVWNAGSWVYRRRQATLTISTSSVVTFDLDSPEEFDSIASYDLYFNDTSGAGMKLRWATADAMAEAKATDTDTGRPEIFRIETAGDSPTWTFSPAPDQSYTVKAEVLVRAPGDPTSAADDTPFSKFTADHMPYLRDLALVKVLYDHNAPDSRTAMAKFTEVCARIDAELSTFQDVTDGDGRGATADVYQDPYYLPTGGMFGGGI